MNGFGKNCRELLPITTIGKALGVFPLKTATVSGNQVFVTSKGAMIYSIFLAVLTFAHFLNLPQMTVAAGEFVTGNKNGGNSSMEEEKPALYNPPLLIRFLNGIAMSFTGFFSKINALTYVRVNFPKSLAALVSIDNYIEGTGSRDLSGRNLRGIRKLTGFVILVGLPGQIYSAIFTSLGKSWNIGIYVVVNNLNNLTAFFAETQFLAICYLLKSRFEIVNERLGEIRSLCDIQTVFSADLKPRFTKNQLSDKRENRKSVRQKNPTHDDVRNLRIAHQRLCDVFDQVNHMFQFQILISITGCFLNQLFNLYSFFYGGSWRGVKNVENIGWHKLLNHPLNNLSWAIYYGARIVAMAIVASITTRAAKNGIVQILEIRRGDVGLATKEELISFYDHLNSRNIQFSAAGLFGLDMALISSVFTTGSTYLVMMVQLKEPTV